jgi:hypothetical protein
MTLQRFLILAGGWTLMVVGLLITPLPIPLPFPVGVMIALIGCAILTTHSKAFRRFIQRVRHRNGWLSRFLEYVTKRAPGQVKHMVRRTRPAVLLRFERMRARRNES